MPLLYQCQLCSAILQQGAFAEHLERAHGVITAQAPIEQRLEELDARLRKLEEWQRHQGKLVGPTP